MGLEGGCFGAKGSCGGIENALGAGYDAIKKEQRLAVFLFLELEIFFYSRQKKGKGKCFALQDKVLTAHFS